MQPILEQQRLREIDGLRGFALLGIIVVNMLFFHSPYIYVDPFTWYQSPADKQAYQWIDIWVQGSFYPLFAMLFGFGLALQAERFKGDFLRFGMKRMTVLLAIGILHVLLLWAGDILITYAASGFVLLFLLRLPKVWLLILSLLMYLLPNGAILLLIYGVVLYEPESAAIYTSIQGVESSILAYGSGSWFEVFNQRIEDWLYINQGGLFLIWMLFTILPLMMFGAWAAKAGIIQMIREKKGKALLLSVLFLAVGTFLKGVPYLSEGTIFTATLQDSFGGPIQAIGYALLFIAFVQFSPRFVFWSLFEKAGKMSLSIYLLMSLLATLFFYSYGLGFYGKVDIATGTWIGLGIYVLCLIFSELWLMKFSRGPMETVWRKLTYTQKKR